MATLMSGKSLEETIVKDNNLILLKKGSDSTKNILSFMREMEKLKYL
jgi:hypothetical protein